MKTLSLYQVDAFSDRIFKGNPAAVCILENPMEEGLMQSIASENNLSETAFVYPKDKTYHIRWFTPTSEVDICGHATLATAHVLYEYFSFEEPVINLYSHRSGYLSVSKQQGNKYTLNFSINKPTPSKLTEDLYKIIDKQPIECWTATTGNYILLVLKTEDDVKNANPNIALMGLLKSIIIITAKGNEVDFVSRCFAPYFGINEDPVTGSIHTILAPLWAKKLNKIKLSARQISERGGKLDCQLSEDRVLITGDAVTYLKGEIYL